MSTKRLQCPKCKNTIVVDLSGGGISNFGGAYCTGSDGVEGLVDGPHTAVEMVDPEGIDNE